MIIVEFQIKYKISQLPAGNKFIGISLFTKSRSFGELFEAFISAIFNVSKSLLGSFGDADDIIENKII
jgi:hypothetical protein